MTATRSAAVPVLLTLATLSCAALEQLPSDLVTADRGTLDAAGRPVPIECLTHNSTLSVPLAQETKGIPGYHDCQRLIIGGRPDRFGPLVQIFASDDLDRITREQFAQTGGMPVAQLYNFSSYAYPVFRIRPRYSCLYLKLLADSSWESRLIHRGGDDTCPILTAWTDGILLQVPSPVAPSPGEQPFPAVARWDWDATRRRNYMAVKCLDQWCEIGYRELTKSPQYGELRAHKPRYDQQAVAVVSGSSLGPGPAATLIPAPGLGTLEVADFDCPAPCLPVEGWVKVADADLSENSIHYRRKLNLTAGVNQMFIRRRLAEGNQEEWQSRIISAQGDTAYFAITRTAHQQEVPAVARWLWYDDDEKAWVRCALGCCESGNRITLQ